MIRPGKRPVVISALGLLAAAVIWVGYPKELPVPTGYVPYPRSAYPSREAYKRNERIDRCRFSRRREESAQMRADYRGLHNRFPDEPYSQIITRKEIRHEKNCPNVLYYLLLHFGTSLEVNKLDYTNTAVGDFSEGIWWVPRGQLTNQGPLVAFELPPK